MSRKPRAVVHLLADRPKLVEAIKTVESHGADVIVAYDSSRLFRDIDVQRAAIERVESADGQFWTVTRGRMSHQTADDELHSNLDGVINHAERRRAKEKSMAAVDSAIAQGHVPWSQTAPGYTRNGDSTLKVDKKLAPVIVKAFKLRADGATVADVRAHLAEHGIVKSYHGTIHLLRDRIYLGEIHFKSRANLSAHPAIVDRELFNRVQRIKVSRGRRAQSERLLARLGVLRCSSCGGRMVIGTQTQHGRNYPFYKCGHVAADCPKRVAISAELVEQMVIDAVNDLTGDFHGIWDKVTQNRRQAASDLEKAQANHAAFMSADLDFTQQATVSQAQKLQSAITDAQERVDKIGGSGRVKLSLKPWERLTHNEKRERIAALVESVTVAPGRGKDRVTIQMVDMGPDETIVQGTSIGTV